MRPRPLIAGTASIVDFVHDTDRKLADGRRRFMFLFTDAFAVRPMRMRLPKTLVHFGAILAAL